MVEALSIKRRKSEHSEISFDSLRSEAIKLIQQISGQQWTDYNLHDPGITILEQLVYSITDLIYRTDFPVEDYLASDDGGLDLESLSLHAPAEALSCRATTCLDYRKLLLDAVSMADNVWVDTIPAQRGLGKYQGLYRISVKLVNGLDEAARNEALEKLRVTFLGARNLCEDLGEISVVKNAEYELCARVEVSSARQPVDILAEIYFACARRIACSVSITGYDEIKAQAPSFDKLFDGPLTRNGVFAQDELPDRQAGFQVSSLFSVINSIEAVDYVQELYLASEGVPFYDRIESMAADEAYDLKIPEVFEDIKVELTTSGRVLRIDIDELTARYNEIALKYHTSRSTPQNLSLLQEPISAVSRPLSRYYSLQNQFPVSYGINQQGVPASAPAETKAKAKQLKAYLVIYEQLLANFLANLDSIKILFSTRTDPPASYSNQILDDDQIADLSAVYPSDAADIFSRIVSRFDNYFERKSRLLDYLLALYGERFSQNSLRHFGFYYARDEVEEAIVANKKSYLESIIELGRDRAAAPDYSLNSRNPWRCGLALRVAMLLGFEPGGERFLTNAMALQDLEMLAHKEYQQRKAGSEDFRVIELEDAEKSILNTFEQPPLIRAASTITLDELREKLADTTPVKNKLLSELLLTSGIDIERYRILQKKSAQSYELVIIIAENKYWKLGSYGDRASAVEAANHLRQYLLLLNRQSEGLHVLEHILLRPSHESGRGQDPGPGEDFFSFRASIVFPLWTARCRNKQFRMLAEETVRLNIPAHIWPEFYWLDYSEMTEFERIYESWRILKEDRESPSAALDNSAQQLLEFLHLHRQSPQAGAWAS